MYKLYYSAGVCSLAIHALLRELGQEVELVDKAKISPEELLNVNPAGTVPVLIDGTQTVQEGAAMALHLLDKHPNDFLPKSGPARTKAIQWMMFANASVHPAYSKMFFLKFSAGDHPAAQEDLLKKAAEATNKLWAIVEAQLGKTKYVAGDGPTVADFMLAVYANWNNLFPGRVALGPNTLRLVREISGRPAFQKALQAEGAEYKV